MAKKKTITSSWGFDGWSLKIWFQKNKLWFIKNKDVIKSFVSALCGYFAYAFPQNQLVAILFGTGGAYLSKLALDLIDYYIAENPK